MGELNEGLTNMKEDCRRTFDNITAGKGATRDIHRITFEDFRQWLLSLTSDQRPAGLRKVNPWKRGSIHHIFDAINTNDDEFIDYPEWEIWWDTWNKKEAKKQVLEDMLGARLQSESGGRMMGPKMNLGESHDDG